MQNKNFEFGYSCLSTLINFIDTKYRKLGKKIWTVYMMPALAPHHLVVQDAGSVWAMNVNMPSAVCFDHLNSKENAPKLTGGDNLMDLTVILDMARKLLSSQHLQQL